MLKLSVIILAVGLCECNPFLRSLVRHNVRVVNTEHDGKQYAILPLPLFGALLQEASSPPRFQKLIPLPPPTQDDDMPRPPKFPPMMDLDVQPRRPPLGPPLPPRIPPPELLNDEKVRPDFDQRRRRPDEEEAYKQEVMNRLKVSFPQFFEGENENSIQSLERRPYPPPQGLPLPPPPPSPWTLPMRSSDNKWTPLDAKVLTKRQRMEEFGMRGERVRNIGMAPMGSTEASTKVWNVRPYKNEQRMDLLTMDVSDENNNSRRSPITLSVSN